jgi:hypothetical protein
MHKMKYCGKEFSADDLERIRVMIEENPGKNRTKISFQVCEELNWYKPDGKLKDMSCRVALLRMEKDGLIKLPPPQRRNSNGKHVIKHTTATDPGTSITSSAGKLCELKISQVNTKQMSSLWNEYIDRYHYLGYKPLPGAQLRYMVYSDQKVLALLGFGAAAWKVASRDQFIGWTQEKRKSNMHLVVNNARFLILPWVCSRNLASKILGMISKRISSDWENRYCYKPVLLETFVECDRFSGGACYKAANWKYVGITKGRGKLDEKCEAKLPKKYIFLYPLVNHFRQLLCN